LIEVVRANLRAVQLLLGHTKLESTVRYLGVDVDDALAISEQVDLSFLLSGRYQSRRPLTLPCGDSLNLAVNSHSRPRLTFQCACARVISEGLISSRSAHQK